MLILKERELTLLLQDARNQLKKVKKIELFNMISSIDKITECQLYEFVNIKHKLRMSRIAAGLLLSRIDKDKDGLISVQDFI